VPQSLLQYVPPFSVQGWFPAISSGKHRLRGVSELTMATTTMISITMSYFSKGLGNWRVFFERILKSSEYH
jgi:hypothetical protein